MNSLPLDEIAAMCGGQPPAVESGRTVRRICKDTRTLVPGDLYLALRGGNFDGNAFVRQAADKGAAAAILDDPRAAMEVPEGFPVILVDDGLHALQRLATSWRDRLALKVVCITGSSGKTSTKEFTASVLGARFRTTKTEGNLNNHFGLPLSILAAEAADGAAVWEIGMNHPGEIAPLAALARPHVGIITNTGVAHIEHLKSREAIAREKGMLFEQLHHDGVAILPAEDAFAESLSARTQARVLKVGGTDSEIRAEHISVTSEGSRFLLVAEGSTWPVQISAPGSHMVTNALLAVAAGIACGLSAGECAERLESTRLTGGRLTRRLLRGVVFLDDTYNANPDSMVAALNVLSSLRNGHRRIAVLGRMGELGEHAAEGYRRVGLSVAEAATVLVAVGSETSAIADAASRAGLADIHQTESPAEAAALLRGIASEGDVVLVKGSRAAGMETVLEKF